MTSRSTRRKQSAKQWAKKNQKKKSKASAQSALRSSAKKLQEGYEEQEYTTTSPLNNDVTKLRELFPNMTSSIIVQVLKNSKSVVDAGEKLGLMTDPCDLPKSPTARPEELLRDGNGKMGIPAIDDDAEYPVLVSTVDTAWDVLNVSRESIDDDAATKLDYVVVTDVHPTDWCLVENSDADSKIPHPTQKPSSYAQACV